MKMKIVEVFPTLFYDFNFPQDQIRPLCEEIQDKKEELKRRYYNDDNCVVPQLLPLNTTRSCSYNSNSSLLRSVQNTIKIRIVVSTVSSFAHTRRTTVDDDGSWCCGNGSVLHTDGSVGHTYIIHPPT